MSGQVRVSDEFKIDAVAKVTECGYPLFYRRFSKVKRSSLTSDYRSRRFYMPLAIIGGVWPNGDHILRQARGFNDFIKDRVRLAIVFGVAKRKPPVPETA